MTSLAVDANVVLRLLTDEPRHLADRAVEILAISEERQIALVLAPMIVAEVVYVLERVYGWTRRALADSLLDLIHADTLFVIDREALVRALVWYGGPTKIDFADAYLAGLVAEGAHDAVATFDEDLGRVTKVPVIRSVAELSLL